LKAYDFELRFDPIAVVGCCYYIVSTVVDEFPAVMFTIFPIVEILENSFVESNTLDCLSCMATMPWFWYWLNTGALILTLSNLLFAFYAFEGFLVMKLKGVLGVTAALCMSLAL
jgi:hypothetical protein